MGCSSSKIHPENKQEHSLTQVFDHQGMATDQVIRIDKRSHLISEFD